MPQINLKATGQPIADFSVNGSFVKVAGVSIDCAERQQDVDTVIEIRENADGPSEGGDGAYLAQILIPARRYIEDVIDDAQDEGAVLRTPVPLDPNAVEITLWPRVAVPGDQS